MGSEKSVHQLKATIWIGKNSVNEGTIEEIKHQLKKRKIVKIRWLKSSSIDPSEIAARSESEILQVRGRTMVLVEKSSKEREYSARNV